MKTCNSIVHILSLACAGLILNACQATGPAAATAAPPNSGHILIYRVANFGSDLSLVVTVDGKDVASLSEGRNYDGYLSPGQHTLSARIDPNPGGVNPWQKTLTVVPGQTYSYTGSWSGGNLKLIPNR